MRVIHTHKLVPGELRTETEKLWLYNGLDCCVTSEVFEAIEPQLDETTRATYEFSKALQAPVLEMRLRGILVDQDLRQETIETYKKQKKIIAESLDQILSEGLGIHDLNPGSPKQLKELFYDFLRLPPVKKRNLKGEFSATVDRDTLEHLQVYFYAQPLVNHILGLRDITKKIGVLETEIDSDGRMRTSYNIAGTTTGRFSSGLGDFGTGTNLQNIEERLRSVFVADAGFKLAYIDLEQAESRLVGAIEWNLFRDGRYLDACESGDLHTSVCRLAWGDSVPWTLDLARDRALASQPTYRHLSFRDMAKKLGHGTNYGGQPHTMAKHTKLDAELVQEFQRKYFAAFPSHQRWHSAVAAELRQKGCLTSLSGRRRWFFGRRDDDATLREAIAFDPQGSVGDILNRGMLQVWRLRVCDLLLQVHDAILVQYPEGREQAVLPLVLQQIQVPVQLKHNRILRIPCEAKVGWNWAGATEDNPDGLRKWTGRDDRKRQRQPQTSQLPHLLSAVQ